MKYYIITYGCQMNKSDSERIASALQNIGYKKTLNIEQANLIIVNMCSVRQSAVDRIFGLSQKIFELKKKNYHLQAVLTGCLLNNDREKFKKIFDFIFNINDLDKLSEWLKGKNKMKKNYLSIKPIYLSRFSAFVPIMTGCNNFCTYCVVPYTRGREISRPSLEILNEIKSLIKRGYKEIFLLGQNVNSYKGKIKNKKGGRKNINKKSGDGRVEKIVNFTELLKLINDVPGKFWIRFITSHPKDLSDELIDAIAKNKKITPYLHLPVQAGDNEILQKMNRGYSVEKYKNLIKKIRKKINGICLSTDIIVGFPGETKKQFNNTVKLMKWAKFDMAYIAKYSPRFGTAAVQFKDNVSDKEKKRREKILTKILEKTALENNKKYTNKIAECLIEKKFRGGYLAKTITFKNVKIITTGHLKIGEFAKIKIIKATAWGLEGKSQKPS